MAEEAEVLEVQNEAPVEVVESHIDEKPPSLRDTILKASEAAKEGKTDEVANEEAKKPRKRTETGQFIKSDEKAQTEVKSKEQVTKTDNSVSKTPQQQEQIIQPLLAPQKASATLKAKWGELPRDLQEDYLKRESDFHKELTKQDEERIFGRQLKDVIHPYMPTIRAEGADPVKAVAELFNTAHLLRTGTPQQKGELLWRTAQTFGADMRQVPQTAQTVFNPHLQQLQQQVQQLQGQITQQTSLKEQQEQSVINQQIETFAADTNAHPHFESVKPHMAALLKDGLAQNLQDAYDQAVYARPDIRSILEAQKSSEAEAKRLADTKAKAEAAKRAGSSLRGSPGNGVTKNGKVVQSNLRDEISAAFRARSA